MKEIENIFNTINDNMLLDLAAIKHNIKRHELPFVYMFDSDIENEYNELVAMLTHNGCNIIDINQYVIIKPEDYFLKLNDCGYIDDTGKLTINDLICDDVSKRCRILLYKLNQLKDVIDHKTVLLITYNDLYLQDETFCKNDNNRLYEIIRSWLKDGYNFYGVHSNIRLSALVLLKTNEKLRDFCMYGVHIRKDDQ